MVKQIITWVDLEGRYRIASPAYNDCTRPLGETEQECLERTWSRIVDKGGYGIPIDHPHYYVEDDTQRAKVAACCGSHFRYAGKPGVDGRRSGELGAWEMDTDGTPTVNMSKARGVHMDHIRVVRDSELVKLDLETIRATGLGDDHQVNSIEARKQVLRDIPQTLDLTTPNDSPDELRAMWPTQLLSEGD